HELHGKTENHPRVRRGDDALPREVFTQPRHFRGREIGIEDESGAFMDFVRMSAKPFDNSFRPSILPNDARSQRLATLRIPRQDRLPLISERDPFYRLSSFRYGLLPSLNYGVVKFHRILLHSSAMEILRVDGSFNHSVDTGIINNNRLRAGRPLV